MIGPPSWVDSGKRVFGKTKKRPAFLGGPFFISMPFDLFCRCVTKVSYDLLHPDLDAAVVAMMLFCLKTRMSSQKALEEEGCRMLSGILIPTVGRSCVCSASQPHRAISTFFLALAYGRRRQHSIPAMICRNSNLILCLQSSLEHGIRLDDSTEQVWSELLESAVSTTAQKESRLTVPK
jgi:hypothetical protein